MTAALDQALEELLALHAEVDRSVALVVARNEGRLACAPGCTGCCVDGLTVFEVEAERIRRFAPAALAAPPHPPGRACALLDPVRGLCRAYEHRPYVCRTQGLPLRWIDEESGGEAVERRDVCPESDGAVALLDLPDEACWTLGPFEGRLAAIEARLDGGELRRVGIRALFRRR